MSPMVDDLVARAAPVTDDALTALALEDLEGELCAAITAQPRGLSRRRRVLSGGRVRIAGALALAACAALALVLVGTGADRVTGRAWAAEAVRVANAVPRLLLDAPGARVTRADEFSVATGEMTFASGGRRFDLSWYRANDRAKDLAADGSAELSTTTAVLGHPARVYRYHGTSDDYSAHWREGPYALVFRASPDAARASGLSEFVALLHALRRASVDDWLSAMPASVVLPVDQAQVVRAMLADIPLPAGLDRSHITAKGDAVHDRYQLGARVAGAAACAWIGQWVQARRDGDERSAEQAVTAMKTSHRWAILHEMQSQGHYAQSLWMYADAIAGSGTVIGGRVLTVEESYVGALGCDVR